MPSIPTLSRHNRSNSPHPTSASTPGRLSSTSGRATSPPISNSSYSPTITPMGQQKLNVVTRVAMEGRAKQDQDGAAIKMYLKMSVPLDSVTPGSTIPLFPEESVKILTSQVHPLDTNSVPYNFSSTVSPLLHNAARALNLPARSQETFHSAFGLSPPPVSSSVASSIRSSKSSASSSTSSENVTVIDGKYTGHILVSGYHISYVLPKVFPPPYNDGGSFPRSSYGSRRASIGERNHMHFMAAIDMWVPYVSRPPRAPYLLSIPTPRCLHNNIKLRIFPPVPTSSSFASLSSADEDSGSWDLASDPHVSRSASKRLSRSSSYNHFADDESSDSSTAGFSEGCGIQGTFPSAERIRVRWARPMKTIDVPEGAGDGRRRVGVKESKGEMTCVVRGKVPDPDRIGAEGVLMDVTYKGTCKGVWFPGVATLLGMDVGLEAKGSDVSWVPGFPQEWEISGGKGYTGFDVGILDRPGPVSRHDSLDSNSPQIFVSPSSPSGDGVKRPANSPLVSRHNSTSSTTSLLRAPLPNQNVADYSFEGSGSQSLASSQATTASSISSLPASTANLTQSDLSTRPPGFPITLHVNMNELLPPSKNPFTFSISGTILVTPRATTQRANGHSSASSGNSSEDSDTESDPEPIVLPRFTVLAADSESTSILIRNEVEGGNANIEVYNSTGDIRNDAQARKTVLQKGGYTKCGDDGGRIALCSVKRPSSRINGSAKMLQPPSRPRTPNGGGSNSGVMSRSASPAPLGRVLFPARVKRDGPLMIPYVTATVTPLASDGGAYPDAYAVRVCLPATTETDSEWLEFGLAKPGSLGESLGASVKDLASRGGRPPKVNIVCVSMEGVPVKFETTAAVKQEPQEEDLGGVAFGEMSGKEWVSWVRVHVGNNAAGLLVYVDYVVREDGRGLSGKHSRKGKEKAKDEAQLNVFLPTFSIPVGRLEVLIENVSEMELSDVQSNITHQQKLAHGRKLIHYSMEEFFYPHLAFRLQTMNREKQTSSSGLKYLIFATLATLLIGLFSMLHLSTEIRLLSRSLEGYSLVVGSGWNDVPEPITVTRTLYATGSRWWFGDQPKETEAMTSVSTTTFMATTTSLSIPIISSASSASFYEASETSLSPTSSPASYVHSLALVPEKLLSMTWEDLRPVRTVASSALKKVSAAINVVWHVFRKVYHYPLDPT